MLHALLLVDLQNDFCPGGALAVQQGDETIPIANRAIALARRNAMPVIASMDWHPAQHGSFARVAGQPVYSQGSLEGLAQIWWPDHCVQDTTGARLHPMLDQQGIDHRIYKGQQPAVDSYSAFFDNGRRAQTGLDTLLKRHNVRTLTVMGLATDYCVLYSVIDALQLGYDTRVIIDGCRGVNLQPDDSQRAMQQMATRGALLQTMEEFSRQPRVSSRAS